MFPQYADMQIPLLIELCVRGGVTRPSVPDASGQTLYAAMAQRFHLSQADLDEVVYEKDGTPRSKWENMVRWVRNDLKKQGLLISPSHGVWAVTSKARMLIRDAVKEHNGGA